jgi:hypothetical protein
MEKILKSYGDKLTVESIIQTLNDIKERYREVGVTVENISVILLILMTEVNKFKKLPGNQKKTLVMLILSHFISELTQEDKQPVVRELLSLTVPALIDNFVSVSKGLELRKLKKKFFCC